MSSCTVCAFIIMPPQTAGRFKDVGAPQVEHSVIHECHGTILLFVFHSPLGTVDLAPMRTDADLIKNI